MIPAFRHVHTFAQTWPVKPVRLIAPYPPGGGVDTDIDFNAVPSYAAPCDTVSGPPNSRAQVRSIEKVAESPAATR